MKKWRVPKEVIAVIHNSQLFERSSHQYVIIMITAIAGNMQPLTQSSQWIIMITFRDKWVIHIYDYPDYQTTIANTVIIIMTYWWELRSNNYELWIMNYSSNHNCELWIMNCTKWIINYESPTIRWI